MSAEDTKATPTARGHGCGAREIEGVKEEGKDQKEKEKKRRACRGYLERARERQSSREGGSVLLSFHFLWRASLVLKLPFWTPASSDLRLQSVR